jgi:hypothetical protein
MSGRFGSAKSRVRTRRDCVVKLLVDEERGLSGGGEVPAARVFPRGRCLARSEAPEPLGNATDGVVEVSSPRGSVGPHPVGSRRRAQVRTRRGALADSWRVGAPRARHEGEVVSS